MKGNLLSTALGGALAACSAAHAAPDVKVYPGNACNAVFGSQADDIVQDPLGILNVGAVNRSVVCPIVRDRHANLDGVGSVRVRVRSPNAATLSCTLFSYSALGDLVESDSNSTTSTTPVPLLLDVDTSTKGGTYSILCSLPPEGEIHGYRVNEA